MLNFGRVQRLFIIDFWKKEGTRSHWKVWNQRWFQTKCEAKLEWWVNLVTMVNKLQGVPGCYGHLIPMMDFTSSHPNGKSEDLIFVSCTLNNLKVIVWKMIVLFHRVYSQVPRQASDERRDESLYTWHDWQVQRPTCFRRVDFDVSCHIKHGENKAEFQLQTPAFTITSYTRKCKMQWIPQKTEHATWNESFPKWISFFEGSIFRFHC